METTENQLPRLLVVSAYELADLALDASRDLEGLASVRTLRGHFNEAVEDIRKLIANGECDVVISAGANAEFLRQHTAVPVVSVRVGGFDVMAALSAAGARRGKTALLLFQRVPSEVERFIKDFRIAIEVRAYGSEAHAHQVVAELADMGIESLVGPGVAVRTARARGMRGIFLYSRASVVDALEEALQLVLARRSEEGERRRLTSVLHHLESGIVATDVKGNIIAANPSADRLTGVSLGSAVGQSLGMLLPDLDALMGSLRTTAGQQQVHSLRGHKMVVQYEPLLDAGIHRGAVFTLNRPRDVEQAFHRLRDADKPRGGRTRYTLDHVVQASTQMQKIVHHCKTLATQSDASVLLSGPTGVGKELLAQGIHSASRRRARRFLAINCGALTASLLESELFGYEAGAFTGARREGRSGLFEAAHNGTVFLDEIGELPLELQTRLLRVLQEKEVTRVGSHDAIPVDVRVICATHRDLRKMVSEKSFRADLYYRLGVLRVEVPALIQRPADLKVFAEQSVSAALLDVGRSDCAASVMRRILPLLTSYAWPGNTREVQNYAHRVAIAVLEADGTPSHATLESLLDRTEPAISDNRGLASKRSSAELVHIRNVLAECGGSQQDAAEILGISRSTLWRRLKSQR